MTQGGHSHAESAVARWQSPRNSARRTSTFPEIWLGIFARVRWVLDNHHHQEFCGIWLPFLVMGNYSALTAFMATYPEMLILRTFFSLNINSLLYQQAELAHLEQELKEIEEDQACGLSPRQTLGLRWAKFENSADACTICGVQIPDSAHNPKDALQWLTLLKICVKLKQYSMKRCGGITCNFDVSGTDKALAQAVQLSALPKPHDRDLRSLLGWLERPKCGTTSYPAGPKGSGMLRKAMNIW